jgi:hypothetical protein
VSGVEHVLGRAREDAAAWKYAAMAEHVDLHIIATTFSSIASISALRSVHRIVELLGHQLPQLCGQRPVESVAATSSWALP